MATTVKPNVKPTVTPTVKPPTTGTAGSPAALAKPTTPSVTAPKTTPSISPPPANKDPFGQFGGKDNYVASQVNRWNNAVNSNDTGLMDRLQTDAYRVGYDLPGANNYKKSDTGLGMGGTGENGLPSDLSWLGAGANSEVSAQIAAYRAQQEAARLAMQQGVDANNAYVKEQIAGLQQQRVVDQDALQQQQNRFGGLYSGGLNYQGGQINSSYAQQQGNLTRDVAARNSALQQQYGAQANSIAQQIAQLQASQPALVNEKIQNYLTQYADQYGTNPLTGQQTAAFQNQNFNQGLSNRQFDRGILESDRNFDRGVLESNRNFDRGVLESDRDFNYTAGRDKVADAQWMKQFDEQVKQNGIGNALNWAQFNLSKSNSATDNALNREKFNYQKEQDKIANDAKSGTISENLLSEAQGMVEAIRSGNMTPSAAYQQIEEDMSLGFYDQATAAYLKQTLEKITPSQPAPTLNEAQQEQVKALPSNAEIDKIWKTEGKGTPQLDFRAWYKSPQGRLGGVDFATWQKLYGPRLGG